VAPWVSLRHIVTAIIWYDLFKSLFLKTSVDAVLLLPQWHPNGMGVYGLVLCLVSFSIWVAFVDMRGETLPAIRESNFDMMAHISKGSKGPIS